MGESRPPRGARAAQRQTAQYLRDCEDKGRRPTVTGLALALGFPSREAFARRAAQLAGTPLGEALCRARSLVEEETLQAAYQRETASGARFLLQTAFGYGEKEPRETGPITVRVEGEEGWDGDPRAQGGL